ncbi:MAG: DUF4129 domain-containing protein [Caldimonas sp.]
MPSPPPEARRRRAGRALGALGALVLAALLASAPARAGTGADRPVVTAAAVEAAASAVRGDPDLGGSHKERTWRFRQDDRPPAKTSSPSAPWLVELVRWLAEGGRVLVWLIGAALVVACLVAARRWLRVAGDAALAAGARLPSHVRQLDIRPESLPDDIGAAVRAAWLAGDRRAALSLLYRGALSRLVHSHAVPIDDASTEGDCVRLARAALPTEPGAFVGRLVLAWQLAVYGNRPLETPAVLALCDDFDRMLPARAPAGPAQARP